MSDRIFLGFFAWFILLIGLAVGHNLSDAARLGERQNAYQNGYTQGRADSDQEWTATTWALPANKGRK